MAFVPTSQLYFPALSPLTLITGGTSTSSFLMNAAGSRVACIFQAPFTGNLDRFEFMTGVVTVGGTLKASFQTVTATGDPSGTVDQFRTAVLADTDDNIWKTMGTISSDGTNSGTKRAVTKGDNVAAVIEFNSFAGTEALNISGFRIQLGASYGGTAYVDTYNGTVWTKQTIVGLIYAVVYEGNVTYPIIGSSFMSTAAATVGINSGSNPNEIGNLITVPFTCKVDGIYAALDADADVDVILYQDLTEITRVRVTPAVRQSAFAQTYFLPITEITLVPGVYRISIKPITATTLTMYYIPVAFSYHWKQYPEGGSSYWIQRQGTGAWAENPLRKAFTGFRISALSDISVSSGGGGGLVASRARIIGGM